MPDSSEPGQDRTNSQRGLRLLRTGLIIAGSALFGGLAVALWDRKSLASLRQPHPEPEAPSAMEDEKSE